MSKVINIKQVQELTLYKELISRNNDKFKTLINQLPNLCDEASERAKQITTIFKEYTLHDETHSIRVTELMAMILGTNMLKKLNDLELIILILSAFYHDQGMIIELNELQNLENNDEYQIFRDNWLIDHPNYFEINEQLTAQSISSQEKEKLYELLHEMKNEILSSYLRESHGDRVNIYILQRFNKSNELFVCGCNITSILAEICQSHTKSYEWILENKNFNYDENIGFYKINTFYLAIILRLADILDFDSDRTPDILFKSIHFTSQISIKEWQKHRSVQGWEISKDLIRFSMKFEHPVYEKTARSFLDWIDIELNHSHIFLRNAPNTVNNYKLNIAEKVDRSRIGAKDNSYIYHDLEFSFSRDEIVKLLMTDKLYKNTSIFVRELLQNSLDALRLRKAMFLKEGLGWINGTVSFSHYINKDGQEVVECKDNGSGMDESIISKYLGKIGRSYYRSPEFERLRIQFKEKDIDFEPCSQFGIGFISCFMIGDKIQIFTRKDNGSKADQGKPLIIEINGIGAIITIKKGNETQEIGTTVRVFCRESPILYDIYSDRVNLIMTLNGYALANEFPIHAKCSIEGIDDETIIPAEIDKKKTFLEKLGLVNIETYEIDVSKIDNDLKGFVRQSFIVDNEGLPCVENDEFKWISSFNQNGINKKLLVQKKIEEESDYLDYSHGREQRSVCLDGILVCGKPGREGISKNETYRLGFTMSRIYSEHAFTIDVRGGLKPELNPAREPLGDFSPFNKPIGWSILQNKINKASGLLWENILSLTMERDKQECFWQLLGLYEGSFFYIHSNLIIKHLQLPIEKNEWIKLSSIQSFEYKNESIYLIDYSNQRHHMIFNNEIEPFLQTGKNEVEWYYRIYILLLCLSKLKSNNKNLELILRDHFANDDIPSDCIISNINTSINAIPLEDYDETILLTTKYINTINSCNPLVKQLFEGKYLKNKNELQEFAQIFIFNVCYLITELNKKNKIFTTKVSLRSLKYTAKLFQKIKWENYSERYRPPYKILIDGENIVEIGESDFAFWAIQKEEYI